MDSLTRRDFVRAAGAAAALTARGYSQVAGAGERLRIGVIGCGGMATGHMNALVKMRDSDNIDILGVCDIYEKRLQAAVQVTGGTPYKDYRRLLDNKGITDRFSYRIPQQELRNSSSQTIVVAPVPTSGSAGVTKACRYDPDVYGFAVPPTRLDKPQ